MKSTSRLLNIYKSLFIFSPWVFLAGMLQYNFQNFISFNKIFTGLEFFDYVSVIDIYIVLIFLVFLILNFKKVVLLNEKHLGLPLKIMIFLIVLAGIVQILFQQTFEPVLVTNTEYFRSLFIFPLIYFVLAFRTLDSQTITRILYSYLIMTFVLCFFALIQYFFGIFPGETKDFMGRLAWPYVDFVTLKVTSANWIAFFVTPAFVLGISLYIIKKNHVLLPFLLICGLTLYLTQSYGAYVAIFISVVFSFFRYFKFKTFVKYFLIILIIYGATFCLQINTKKFQVSYSNAEYKYSNSVESRKDIYAMNFHILTTRPFLAIGLNQYQSYFKQNDLKVLGHQYGEMYYPPHAHNFLISVWVSLGVLGFISMVILILDILKKRSLSFDYPAFFAFIAIMTHGLIDSYYWKQEIVYIFWMIILFIYLVQMSATHLREK